MKGTYGHPLRVSCRGVGFELTDQLLMIAHSPSLTTPWGSGGSSMARCLVGMVVILPWCPRRRSYCADPMTRESGIHRWVVGCRRIELEPRRRLQMPLDGVPHRYGDLTTESHAACVNVA